MPETAEHCNQCGRAVTSALRNYRYTESGLANVVLQGVWVAECHVCGEVEVTIPHPAKVHRAIALALTKSPFRLTGEQLRFLRKYVGQSGGELAAYLHTDKTKISKWERGEDPIGSSTDRLVRLLVAALDSDLRADITAIAMHLPEISDDSGEGSELAVDAVSLQSSFTSVRSVAHSPA